MSPTLLDQITSAVADEYAVLGQLGETARGSAFLARERAGGHLVVLTVPPAADELAVLAVLADEVPANAGTCTACGQAPAGWSAYCPTCGRAFVQGAVDAHRFTVETVHAATAHAYDVLGEVAHQAGGSLFFVRDRADGRLVALAGQVGVDGGQALEAVWNAARGQRDTVAQHVYESGSRFDALPPVAAVPPAGLGTPLSAASGAPDYAPLDQPPGYPPEYGDQGTGGRESPRPSRRRWVPFAVAGALVLVAGGAWAAMRDGPAAAHDPVPHADSAHAAPATPASLPRPDRLAASGPAVAPPPAPPVPPVDNAPPSHSNRSAAGDPAQRALAAPAFVQLQGRLPAGWTWSINGRRGPASLTARLRPNRPAVLTIEAPGYCPEVLRVDAPAAGAVQPWAPRLRGKPMVGEC